MGSFPFMLLRRGTPLLIAVGDNPFSDDVNDLIGKLLCDVPREGVPPFLAEPAVPKSTLAKNT